jgi:hypothetical protein
MAIAPNYGGQGPARTARLPGVDPRAYGTDLARDAGALAGAVNDYGRARAASEERVASADHQTAMIEDERRLRAKKADRAAALATMQADLLGEVQTLRANAAAGAAGHEAKVAELIDKRVTDFMGTLDDARLVDDFKPDVAGIAGSLKVSEQQFAILRGADKAVTDFTGMRDTLANSLFTSPSTANLVNAESLSNKAIDAMDLPEDKKAELRRDTTKQYRIRAWQGSMNINPQGALAALDAGVLNDVAEAGELVSLRASAQSAVDRVAAQARATQSATLTAFRESARLDVERVNEGVEVDADDLDARSAQAAAAGEVDLAHDLGIAAIKSRVTIKYGGANTAELEAAKREIERSGEWRKDEKLVASHSQLGVLIQRVTTRASSDKLGLWSENGGKLTPLDLGNAGALRARAAEARAAQKRYGGPLQMMTEAEAAPLRDQFAKGSAGDRASMIETFGLQGNDVAKAYMRQIAPAQPQYATLVDLATMRNAPAGRAIAREALSGWTQIAANPKLVDPAMQSEIDRAFGPALAMVDGTTRQGVMETARGIYANRAAQRALPNFDRKLFVESYKAALGAAGDGTGGVGKARGGDPVVLPRGMSQRDLDVTFARAEAADLVAAAGQDAPLWGGKTMTAGQFKTLVPVMVSDGRYMFRSGSGFARSKMHGGQNFVLDVRALARLAAGRR